MDVIKKLARWYDVRIFYPSRSLKNLVLDI